MMLNISSCKSNIFLPFSGNKRRYIRVRWAEEIEKIYNLLYREMNQREANLRRERDRTCRLVQKCGLHPGQLSILKLGYH